MKAARRFPTGFIRNFPPALKFCSQQVYHGTRHHFKVHPSKLPTSWSRLSLPQNTAKPGRNRGSGNLELNDSGVCLRTGDTLQRGEGPSPLRSGRAEDNTELLAWRHRFPALRQGLHKHSAIPRQCRSTELGAPFFFILIFFSYHRPPSNF